jgi:hypothetical protein
VYAIINWLKNAERYEIKGRGIVYAGESPFTFSKDCKEDMDRFYKMPWVISHDDARDKLWRVKGVESWAIMEIHAGAPIGILVEHWDEN